MLMPLFKKILSLASIAIFTLPVHAQNKISLNGPDAQELFDAIPSTSAGTLRKKVENLLCNLDGHCSFELLNGNVGKLVIQGDATKALYRALPRELEEVKHGSFLKTAQAVNCSMLPTKDRGYVFNCEVTYN